MKKINMIKTAQLNDQRLQESIQSINEHVSKISTSTGIPFDTILENITHVLANFSTKVKNGKDIIALGRNVDGLATFLSGVERIAFGLPKDDVSPTTKIRTLQLLQNLNIGSDQLITGDVTEIVDLGLEKPELVAKYKNLVLKYRQTQGVQATPLINAIDLLQTTLQRSLAAAQKQIQQKKQTPAVLPNEQQPKRNTLPPAGPSRAGSMSSGGSGV